MRTGHAIIGANYGDEGKGLMTDFFARQDPDNTVVIRFNGGAQAGHTVVTPDGRRHVFSHFGAGSFSGCPTYLSQFFIVNPLLFVKELDQLRNIGITPSISIHADAIVTTPFDMLINQIVEMKRGSARHGSCGIGINETVTRTLRHPAFELRVNDLPHPDRLLEKLIDLEQTWFPLRLKEHQMELDDPQVASFISKSTDIMTRFISDVSAMLNQATITFGYPKHAHVIFEGAQGLMLDEDRLDQFPHVTRSKTNLSNVTFLARKMNLDKLDVTYVTRTYLTRHGAGPLPGECDRTFCDTTNIPNQFQGHLRFAPLDIRQLNRSIDYDLSRARRIFTITEAGIAVTCLDQLSPPSDADLILPIRHIAAGPTCADVRAHYNRSLNCLVGELERAGSGIELALNP